VNHLKQFEELLLAEPSLLFEGLWDGPKAYLAALLAKKSGKNILIISGEGRQDRLLDNLSFFGAESLFDFPAWETLPGEEIAPSSDIVGKRFEVLHRLATEKKSHIVLASMQACFQHVLPPDSLVPFCCSWKKGDEILFHTIAPLLESIGYVKRAIASDKGEFALRGGIIDVFPTCSPDPFRIEFFGDTIEQIRTFDPVGQKSIGKVDSLFISPAREDELLKMEAKPSLLFDYLGKEAIVIFDDLLSLEDRYVRLKKMEGSTPFFEEAFRHRTLFWSKEPIEELSDVLMGKKVGRAFYSGQAAAQPIRFSVMERQVETKRSTHPFVEIGDYFSPGENSAVGKEEIIQGIGRVAGTPAKLELVAASDGEELTLKNLLKGTPLPADNTVRRGYLTSGFVVPDELILLPMPELTRRYKTRREKWRSTYHTPPSEFHEIQKGDVVVHFHQGIGRFLGIEKQINHLKQESEFMVIEYAESGKLFVPLSQSHLVSRYIGSREEMPTFSTLGSGRWQKTKNVTQQAIVGYAEEMLRRNAEREIQGGFQYPVDSAEMEAFELEFPFTETEDQLRAIHDVKRDMCATKAMDRLICGDVGYGKTEVAMRAAYKAVVDGKKQVAVLVPTTVLAQQHAESFAARMANTPVTVASVSRFNTPKENKTVLEKVKNGSVDILIGTHRLLSKDVTFKDLGLIIIDEEQRFGVRAKEALKAFKAGVDCLTMSATPIPRTLYMSLIGAREISTINTPPQDRLPIKTLIAARENQTIQNALLRELSRDGQAFFIHNRIETLFQVGEELQKLLPQARVLCAHGQMDGDEIDTLFHAFKSGKADILVTTTIVENGVDIPNANTILIDRSDTFGLADLYQLRGRVGRWNRPAYAYFLIPPQRELPEIVRKRLYALAESSGYGGGMKIAMRDLEIRGAGDILGTQQSGQVAAIGFHLYCKLLKRTIAALSKKEKPSFTETKMEFSYNAKLSEEYIPETSLRLEIYHRLGEATTPEEVDAILAELIDRFGPAPSCVYWLYHLTRIRVIATAKQIVSLKFDTHTVTIETAAGKRVAALGKVGTPADLEAAVVKAMNDE
jgi:transcription-repair coupling factor (superfamily II helicase)